MDVIEKTRNDIKAYVRSLNTPDNTVYQENELLILFLQCNVLQSLIMSTFLVYRDSALGV